jgi:hypothetical protein
MDLSEGGEKTSIDNTLDGRVPSSASGLSLSILRISIADMMALNVRSETKHSAPKFLFQKLPVNAMSVIATLPHDVATVSIPQQNEICEGYSIHEVLPADADCFVIVYARKSNERYEAVEIQFQGRSYRLKHFYEKARRSFGENQSGSKCLYFVPGKKLWGVILRDGGYTVFDPSKMQNRITGELLDKLNDESSSGVIARISYQAEAFRPVFARVELTLEPGLSPGKWISFIEYQRLRALQSRPPDVIIAGFREWLKTLGEESRIQSWIFRKGMFFGDHGEWWGSKDRRRTEHEGLDFAEGMGIDGKTHEIPEGTPVRAIADGEFIALLDDFLAKTVVLRHPAIRHENGNILYTFYSHIIPANELTAAITRGMTIGRMGRSMSPRTPAHLHITGAWIPQSIRPETITLDHINPAFMPVILINFNSMIYCNPNEQQ